MNSTTTISVVVPFGATEGEAIFRPIDTRSAATDPPTTSSAIEMMKSSGA